MPHLLGPNLQGCPWKTYLLLPRTPTIVLQSLLPYLCSPYHSTANLLPLLLPCPRVMPTGRRGSHNNPILVDLSNVSLQVSTSPLDRLPKLVCHLLLIVNIQLTSFPHHPLPPYLQFCASTYFEYISIFTLFITFTHELSELSRALLSFAHFLYYL